MSYQNANYSAFYVSEPFSESNLGAISTHDFVYYNMLRMWKGEDNSFPFNDAHDKTYNVRDGSDWEKTLKPRLHTRLDNSKNIILFLSSITANSRALREEMNYGIGTKGLPVIVIYKIREWTFTADDLEASSDEENREKPWDRMKNFAKSDVDGKMDITLSNGIYVDSTNLKPAMQNKIRRMAAFSNPVFYKNSAIGTSNYDTSRWIYLGKDYLGGYIQIPRGLQDELIANIDKAGIEYTIDDERQQGRNINVEFNGELRPEQNKALKELTKHDNGILHAATAFGKTVVCSAVIAEKKVNTLILLESSALIEQWKDALNKFLFV